MSRVPLFATVAAIVALGTYALWPEPSAPTAIRALPAGATFPEWTASLGDRRVALNGGRVTVSVGSVTSEYAPSTEKPSPWAAFSAVEVPAAKVVENVGDDRLPAYGLAPGVGGELATADRRLRLRWGASDGQAYVWNSQDRRLLVVDAARIAALDASLAPPIEAAPLAKADWGRRVVVDGLMLESDGSWFAAAARNRPPFDRRLRQLLGSLMRIEVTDFAGVPTAGLPLVGSVTIDAPPLGVSTGLASKALGGRTIEVFAAGDEAVVRISGYPAQRPKDLKLAELRAWFAAFRGDVLVDLRDWLPNHDVERIELSRDGAPWWSLRRRPKPAKVGGYWWDVVWSGGREPAADGALAAMLERLATVAVRDPVPDSHALDALPAGAVVLSVVNDRPDTAPVRIALAGGELRTAAYRARLADDGRLRASLEPERSYDPKLIHRDPWRVAKIQRRFRSAEGAAQAGRDEVVVRGEGGRWSRSWPTGDATPVDGTAIDRFVRALSVAVTSDLRPVQGDGRGDGSRTLRDTASIELAVRFAALADREASNDETDLDATTAQDWGIALSRDGNRWIGVDLDLGLRFTLDDDTVEELTRPFTGGQVFPLVASAVTSLEIRRGEDRPVRLARKGAGWTVADGDAAPVEADALAVRRWFRDIASLTAPGGALDGRAPEPTPAEMVGRITVTLPSIAGDPWNPTEVVTLAVLKPGERGQPVHVWSNRGGSRFPRGRTVLPTAQAMALLADAPSFRK